jgi:hypothetical protein
VVLICTTAGIAAFDADTKSPISPEELFFEGRIDEGVLELLSTPALG